jgi:rhodanese-related sulfurtransferase
VEPTFKRIGIDAACTLLSHPDILILDVRDPASFQRAHIAAAVNVSPENVFPVLQSAPKNRPVLIYCYHGNSSQTYAQLFADYGFTEVYSLDGGYEEWHVRRGPPPP